MNVLALSTPLVTVELIAAGIWVGSLVCLAVVASAARRVLDSPSQVVFFQAVGRRYGIVGTGALVVAIGAGLALAWPPSSWSGQVEAAVALAGALILVTAAGMAQARAMTVLRRRAVSSPGDAAVAAALHRGRLLATGLRSLMALMTLGVLVLAAQVIAH